MRSYRSRKRYHNFLFLYESAPEERSAAVIDTNENSWIEDFVICLRNNKKLVDSRAHQNVAEDPRKFSRIRQRSPRRRVAQFWRTLSERRRVPHLNRRRHPDRQQILADACAKSIKNQVEKCGRFSIKRLKSNYDSFRCRTLQKRAKPLVERRLETLQRPSRPSRSPRSPQPISGCPRRGRRVRSCGAARGRCCGRPVHRDALDRFRWPQH